MVEGERQVCQRGVAPCTDAGSRLDPGCRRGLRPSKSTGPSQREPILMVHPVVFVAGLVERPLRKGGEKRRKERTALLAMGSPPAQTRGTS